MAVGKVIDKYKVAKHFRYTIADTSLTVVRKQSQIDAEAALDGIYVLRTSVPATDLDAAGISWPATKTSPTSNATSASSKPTTWTYAPSTAALPTGSMPTC